MSKSRDALTRVTDLQLGVMALKELRVSIEPELMTRRNFCRDCVWKIGLGAFCCFAAVPSMVDLCIFTQNNTTLMNIRTMSRCTRSWKIPRLRLCASRSVGSTVRQALVAQRRVTITLTSFFRRLAFAYAQDARSRLVY